MAETLAATPPAQSPVKSPRPAAEEATADPVVTETAAKSPQKEIIAVSCRPVVVCEVLASVQRAALNTAAALDTEETRARLAALWRRLTALVWRLVDELFGVWRLHQRAQ